MDKKRAVLVLVMAAVSLVACGGGDDPQDDPAVEGEANLDVEALEETLAGFNTEVESEFGFFTAPEYDSSDGSVLGYLSTGVDPVVFCDRLAGYVADEGFDGLTVNVRVTTTGPILATGEAGGSCAAA